MTDPEKQALEAIAYMLRRAASDPDVCYVMHLTESHAKLVAAYAALTSTPESEVRAQLALVRPGGEARVVTLTRQRDEAQSQLEALRDACWCQAEGGS